MYVDKREDPTGQGEINTLVKTNTIPAQNRLVLQRTIKKIAFNAGKFLKKQTQPTVTQVAISTPLPHKKTASFSHNKINKVFSKKHLSHSKHMQLGFDEQEIRIISPAKKYLLSNS